MKNDELNQLWNKQKVLLPSKLPQDLIAKAKAQRRGQFLSIAILGFTVVVLLLFSLTYATSQWNGFSFGLMLMIASLLFRIIIEYSFLFRKERQLIALDHSAYRSYLARYYRSRLWINYLVTPLCFALYVFGFSKLLPYFKQAFSPGFYTYIVVSGVISLLVLVGIVGYSVIKEERFLRTLKEG